MNDLDWCITYLKKINHINYKLRYDGYDCFRALLNITMPINLSDEFYLRQDNVLKDLLSKKVIIDVDNFKNGISLYKGDITLIKADAIVNACNSDLLGCFIPLHHCIDNAIHSFAGLQVRRDLLNVMQKQGHKEKNGLVKVTNGYNLPSKYIFHTVGPIYNKNIQNDIDLKNCYLSCLKKADEMGLESIVLCSISTGVFSFPIDKASDIAINAVRNYLNTENKNIKKVIFDLFSDSDYDVYDRKIKEINK